MTKPAKHFAYSPEVTETIDYPELPAVGFEAYSDAGCVALQATHRGMSRVAIFALSGVMTSTLLAGAVFLSSPGSHSTATAQTSTLAQGVGASLKADAALPGIEAEAKKNATAKAEAEARIAESEKAKAQAEERIKKAEEEKTKAEADAKAAEERVAAIEAAAEESEAEAREAEPHTVGEDVTISLPTAEADIYAEWEKDEYDNWWASFSTFNGTAVRAIPDSGGGWLFYAETDNGLVEIQRVNESSDEGASGPGGISSHWTDIATNTIWY